MTAHAVAGPSSAGMWMNCPASVTLANGRVRPSSVYAKEGTAAHQIAEMILGGDMFPPPRITVEGTEFIVGVNMLRHLRPYINLVQAYEQWGYTVYTEQKVHLSVSGGLVWGTADCVAVKGASIRIVDLKYGMGVPVSPDSVQLKIYALGALEAYGRREANGLVGLTVVQPRLDPEPQTVEMTVGELRDWSATMLAPAIEKLTKGDTTENAGPWCRWCVRRGECHAFAHQRSGQAADVFNDTYLDGGIIAP